MTSKQSITLFVCSAVFLVPTILGMSWELSTLNRVQSNWWQIRISHIRLEPCITQLGRCLTLDVSHQHPQYGIANEANLTLEITAKPVDIKQTPNSLPQLPQRESDCSQIKA